MTQFYRDEVKEEQDARATSRAMDKSPMKPAKQAPAIIVIGIDFGTTFSGVAYANSRRPDVITVVSSWESQDRGNAELEKTATAIHYEPGRNQEITWGFAMPPDKTPLQWFKLLLLNDTDLSPNLRNSEHIIRARRGAEAVGKNAVKIIADYLRRLWEHSIERIKSEIGAAMFNYAKLRVVMTLPAIWPQYAQIRLGKAAELAGILSKPGTESISFVTEPEAAAVATLTDLDDNALINVGDCFVVVDCGGGTVDLISYEITQKKPLAVAEAAQGDGDLCGAKVTDNAFETILREKFGEPAWERLSSGKLRKIKDDEWENGIKSQYKHGDPDSIIDIPFECITEEERRNLVSLPQVTLAPDEIEGIFEPAFGRIHDMVDKQITAVEQKIGRQPKYIMLVGGFGRCSYLYQEVKARAAEKDIQVLQSRTSLPWTAICRGAVIHGLSTQKISSRFAVSVESRISRANYGICFDEKWRAKRHAKRDREYDERFGDMVARRQMDWFLKVGQDVSTKQPVERRLQGVVEGPGDVIEHKIHTCKEDRPPRRLTDEVSEACVITCSCAKIDFSNLEFECSPAGKRYYKLEFLYKILCNGRSLEFTVSFQDQPLARESISIDFTEEKTGNMRGKVISRA